MAFSKANFELLGQSEYDSGKAECEEKDSVHACSLFTTLDPLGAG